MTKQTLEHRANRIADSIVELVERTDGAVTLAQVNREVAGFAKQEPPFWDHFIEHAGVETLYWDGMTEAGAAALQKVLRGRRVAVQFVSPVPYILDDLVSDDEHWQPIVLLPARAANLDSPKWLVRASQKCIAKALEVPGWRQLRPAPVSFTADPFSL